MNQITNERGTGRTARMIDEAIQADLRGEKVLIIAGTPNAAHEIRDRVRRIHPRARIITSTVGEVATGAPGLQGLAFDRIQDDHTVVDELLRGWENEKRVRLRVRPARMGS
jgi:hypothetical protein